MMVENIHALIVDDDEQFSFLIETYLSIMGITSKVAVNGINALEILQENTFDFIMTDFQMPSMDGLELIKNIRRHKTLSTLKIIFVTGGGGDVEDIKEAENLADQYIIKPFTLDVLRDKVNNLNLR